MEKLPLIGITTYHRDARGYTQLPGQYADAVRRAGGLPLLLQPGEKNIDQLIDLLDGVILSGGGDVDPKRYEANSDEEVYWVDQERDDFEFELARRLVVDAEADEDRPVLCICRGMQVLNVAAGGTLIPHIPSAVPDAIDHRQPPDQPYGHIPHPVDVKEGSTLGEIMGENRVIPASWHHQSVDQVGSGLEIVASASDGIIEALEVTGRPWVMAVQWHPELTAAEDATQQRLFDRLVEQAKKQMRKK